MSISAHRAFLILPFKGRNEVGMGADLREANPIPIPTFPLKGKESQH